jgi:hypothetical protein
VCGHGGLGRKKGELYKKYSISDENRYNQKNEKEVNR